MFTSLRVWGSEWVRARVSMNTHISVGVCVGVEGGVREGQGGTNECSHPVHRMWEVTNFDSKEVPFLLLC